jgi:cytochrome c oxidase cbb3-type subunit 3
MSEQNLQSQTVQTTGHAWDGDLQEFNNPLPTWWVYTFYVTIVFAIIYWFIYPSWPFGKGFLTGFSNITYVNKEGEKVTSHWNTRALLMEDLNKADEKQKPFFSKVLASDYDQIAKDPDLNGFVLSAGKALFSDNCAACHQQGGQGKLGFFPNLTDDDWLYGGTFEKIHQTITNGRRAITAMVKTARDARKSELPTSRTRSGSGPMCLAPKRRKTKSRQSVRRSLLV